MMVRFFNWLWNGGTPVEMKQPLTDDQLRDTPVPVEDGHPDPQQDALTNAQLRASAVPVDDGHPDPQQDALTNAQLRAAAVPVDDGHPDALTNAELRNAPVGVRDDYAAVEHEADQNGAGQVLDFTLSAAAEFVIVDADNLDSADYTAYRCRATLDGSEPTEDAGFVCRSGQGTYLPFPTAGQVKVWAPAGVVVAVQAGRR